MKTIASSLILSLIVFSSASFAQGHYGHSHNQTYSNHQTHVHGSYCFQKQYQVWVPERYERKLIPAQYKTVRNWCSRRRGYFSERVLVRPAFYKNILIRGYYTTKTKWVCKSSFRKHRRSHKYKSPKRVQYTNPYRYQNNYNIKTYSSSVYRNTCNPSGSSIRYKGGRKNWMIDVDLHF